jgi:hypothetical protein
MALPAMLAAILGGLGQGVGAGAANIQAQHADAQNRERQAKRDALAERSVNLAERQYDESFATVDPASIPEPLRPIFAPGNPQGPIRMRPDMHALYTRLAGDRVQKAEGLAREQAAANQVRDIFRKAQGAPGQPTSALAPGEDPEAGAFIGSTGFKPPMGKRDILGEILGVPGLTTQQAALAREGLESDKFTTRNPEHDVIGPDGAVVHKGTPKPTEPKAPHYIGPDKGGKYHAVTMTPEGPKPSAVPGVTAPPKEAPQPSTSQLIDKLTVEYQTLRASGVPENDPRAQALAQRINNQKLVAYHEGGGLAGPMGTVRPPTQKPPEASERKELAEIDAARTGVGKLLKGFEKNQGVLGNVVSNPVGALRRGAGSVLPTLSADERAFLSGLAIRVADLKRQLIGMAQTIPELRTLADALPDKGEIGPAVFAKLKEIDSLLETKRGAIGNVLQQSNRSVPTPTGQQGGDGWTITERK